MGPVGRPWRSKGDGHGGADQAHVTAWLPIEWTRSEVETELVFAPEMLRELERVPQEVSQIVGLTEIGLNHSKLRDLTAFADIVTLRAIHLNRTNDSDLTPLTGLIRLEELYVSATAVSDLASLAGPVDLSRFDAARSSLSGSLRLEGQGAFSARG